MQSSAVRSKNTIPIPAASDCNEGRAVDLVHLAQQSLGDKELEIELLTLFERQAETIMARLKQPVSSGDRKWKQDLTHTLKGSARAVGACKVAIAAQNLEEILGAGPSEDELAAGVERLGNAVAEARAIICDLIRTG